MNFSKRRFCLLPQAAGQGIVLPLRLPLVITDAEFDEALQVLEAGLASLEARPARVSQTVSQ